jgi:hypothetical protein
MAPIRVRFLPQVSSQEQDFPESSLLQLDSGTQEEQLSGAPFPQEV